MHYLWWLLKHLTCYSGGHVSGGAVGGEDAATPPPFSICTWFMGPSYKHSSACHSRCNLWWSDDPVKHTLTLLPLPSFPRLTCEDDRELAPVWKPGWGSRCPVEWTDCPLDIRDSARLMMSPMRWMKPSFSDGRMNSLCTLRTQWTLVNEGLAYFRVSCQYCDSNVAGDWFCVLHVNSHEVTQITHFWIKHWIFWEQEVQEVLTVHSHWAVCSGNKAYCCSERSEHRGMLRERCFMTDTLFTWKY